MIEIYNKYMLKSYVHLTFCVAALTAFTYISIDQVPDLRYVLFVGLGTLLVYNYNEVFSFEWSQLTKWLQSKPSLFPIIMLVFSAGLIAPMLQVVFLPLLISLLACILYFRPVRKDDSSLRSIPFFKVFLISIVFGLLTGLIPLLNSGYSWNEIILMTMSRMLFVGALAIAFDIGDLLLDSAEMTNTLPALYGKKKAKYLGLLLLILAAFIEIYCGWIFIVEFPALVMLLITYFISGVLLMFSGPDRSKFYYLFAIDGMMGLPYLLSLL